MINIFSNITRYYKFYAYIYVFSNIYYKFYIYIYVFSNITKYIYH